MTLTPEQFNIIATKDDLKVFITRDEFNKTMSELKTTLDGIAKAVGVNEVERASNIAAHDRFEARITRTEKELKLDPIFF